MLPNDNFNVPSPPKKHLLLLSSITRRSIKRDTFAKRIRIVCRLLKINRHLSIYHHDTKILEILKIAVDASFSISNKISCKGLETSVSFTVENVAFTMRSFSWPDARRNDGHPLHTDQPCLFRSESEVRSRGSCASRRGIVWVMLARRVVKDDEEIAFWWRNARHAGTWATYRYRSFGFRPAMAVVRPGQTIKAPRLCCWFPRPTCPEGGIRGYVGEFLWEF